MGWNFSAILGTPAAWAADLTVARPEQVGLPWTPWGRGGAEVAVLLSAAWHVASVDTAPRRSTY